jgi:hypothetical protein
MSIVFLEKEGKFLLLFHFSLSQKAKVVPMLIIMLLKKSREKKKIVRDFGN